MKLYKEERAGKQRVDALCIQGPLHVGGMMASCPPPRGLYVRIASASAANLPKLPTSAHLPGRDDALPWDTGFDDGVPHDYVSLPCT